MRTHTLTGTWRVALVLFISGWFVWSAGVAQSAPPANRTKPSPVTPKKKPVYSYPVGSYEDDTLLLMPTKGAEQEEIDKAIKETGGRVVGKIENKNRTIYKLQVPKGKLTEVEKTLSEDENFKQVVRNLNMIPNATSGTGDPNLSGQWYLNSVRAKEAWILLHFNKIQLAPITIAVVDTGCQSSIKELSGGRCQPGYDASSDVYGAAIYGGGQVDVNNHGTWVATTAAANPNNGVGTAGVAPNANIYPIRVANSKGKSDLWKLMNGLNTIEDVISQGTPIKIVNISMNAAPPNTIANMLGAVGPMIQPYIDDLYGMGAIVFNAAGNDNKLDTSPMCPHLCVVSAMTNTNTRATFSNCGPSVWFTAPGQGITCSGRTGAVATLSGTSLASPVCAGVAALIWGVNPSLKNYDVLKIMTETCDRTKFKSYSANAFGYGQPDCVEAVKRIQPYLSSPPLPPTKDGGIDIRLLALCPPATISVNPINKNAQYQMLLKAWQQLMNSLIYE